MDMQYLDSYMETIIKTSFDRIFAFQIAATIAKEGSFIAASKRLGITPSNITKEIKKLEDYLGVKLFKRTTRSISLTEEGALAIDKSKQMINILQELEDDLQGNVKHTKGSIKITAPTTLGQVLLSKLIAQFQKENPYIEIDMVLSDNILDPIEHGIDLSIRSAFELSDSNQYAKRIGQLERVLCASPDYIKHFKRPMNVDDLQNHNCLMHMRGASPFYWTLIKNKKRHDVKIKGSYKSNRLATLVDACKESVGILNCPRYLVENDLIDGTLTQVLKSWKLPAHQVYLITTNRPTQSKRLQKLVEFLESKII
jgi:DNA-binding transcriptional LysR family regulator